MARPLFITEILKARPLVEFLADRGYSPASTGAGRSKYHCPLHDDSDPSFYVFDDPDGTQHYHCYGCNAHGDVINLAAAMDRVSVKQAIRNLAQGVSISSYDDLEAVLRDVEDVPLKQEEHSLEMIVYSLSRSCYHFLKEVNFDPLEVEFMDQVYERIDRVVKQLDTAQVKKLYETIVGEGLNRRMANYMRRREQDLADSVAATRRNPPQTLRRDGGTA